MKIALIGNDYCQQFPLLDYGGIESCVENTANGMHQNKLDFFVIVPKRESVTINYDFAIFETNERPTSITKNKPYNFCQQARDIIIREKPDVIWSQSHWSAELLHDLGIPIICTFHDSCQKEEKWLKQYKNVYYRFISKFQYNNWIKTESEKNMSFQCYTGIDNNEYSYYSKDNTDNYFLWCAGLQWGFKEKGLDIFIEISRNNPDELFLAYGSGDIALMSSLMKQKEIKNFRFLGKLSRGPMHRTVFGKAKAFIIPTQIPDTFPRTCLESISKGTPIIGSRMGSIPEIVESNNCGVLCQNIKEYNLSIKNIDSFDRKNIFDESKKYNTNQEIKTLLLYSQKLLSIN